jgi:hypothetical protein
MGYLMSKLYTKADKILLVKKIYPTWGLIGNATSKG